jgi:hypothetical protein
MPRRTKSRAQKYYVTCCFGVRNLKFVTYKSYLAKSGRVAGLDESYRASNLENTADIQFRNVFTSWIPKSVCPRSGKIARKAEGGGRGQVLKACDSGLRLELRHIIIQRSRSTRRPLFPERALVLLVTFDVRKRHPYF